MQIVETAPFSDWLSNLRDVKGRAVIVARIARLKLSGNFGDWNSVGDGVGELRVHFGPGYRVYFCRRGEEVVILLGGGDKKSQTHDMAIAKKLAKEL